MKKLLTPKELGDALGVCRRTITRWEDRGLIQSIKMNARVFRFDPDDVDALVENLKGRAA